MDEVANSVRRNQGMKYLGSIDPLTAANWAKECGAAIGTKEFTAYAKKKLASGDYGRYRAKPQRVVYNGHDLR